MQNIGVDIWELSVKFFQLICILKIIIIKYWENTQKVKEHIGRSLNTEPEDKFGGISKNAAQKQKREYERLVKICIGKGRRSHLS